MKMSSEWTDRETVLIKWILFLIDVVNRYSVFFGLINRDVAWLDGIWEKDNIKDKQDELLEVLSSEFDISFSTKTNREYLDGEDENE